MFICDLPVCFCVCVCMYVLVCICTFVYACVYLCPVWCVCMHVCAHTKSLSSQNTHSWAWLYNYWYEAVTYYLLNGLMCVHMCVCMCMCECSCLAFREGECLSGCLGGGEPISDCLFKFLLTGGAISFLVLPRP